MNPIVKKTLLTTSLTGVFLNLTACGGSTNTGSITIPTPKEITAKFLDVANLQYTTSSGQSGTTGTKGEFTCKTGDTVTFKVGGLTLGKAPCQRVVTSQTLAATEKAGSVTTNLPTIPKTDPKVINRERLLLTLDNDGDPTNGIVLPKTTEQQNITSTNIDFANTSNFENKATTEILPKLSTTRNTSLKTITEAETHIKTELQKLKTDTTLSTLGQYYDETSGGFKESNYEKDHSYTSTGGGNMYQDDGGRGEGGMGDRY